MTKIETLLTLYPNAKVSYDNDRNCYVRIQFLPSNKDSIVSTLKNNSFTVNNIHTDLNGNTYFVITITDETITKMDELTARIASLQAIIEKNNNDREIYKTQWQSATTIAEKMIIISKALGLVET